MKESADIRRILQDWPYDPEEDARLIQGEDGREILQVRTPVGIEQYELDGRPDGVRPHGLESALDYYLQRLQTARTAGHEVEFKLDRRECNELFSEGTLYYFRYVRLFQLKDWVRTVRDTSRNLRVFDLIRQYARREEDQQFLEKWRPYIIRIHSSAGAMIELEKHAYDAALRIANQGVHQIEALDDLDDETFKFECNRSLTALRELASQIRKNRPLSELEALQHQLRRAIERQEFEKAAQLRDRIRDLKKQQIC
jgi:UvrB/uvrC motif